MFHYLIVCRSLTYAQRTLAVLERQGGIPAHILRTPKSISENGCSYSVKISQSKLSPALSILDRTGLSPKHVYMTCGDGIYQEAEM